MPRIDTHHHLAAPACLGPLQEVGIIMPSTMPMR